MDNVMRALKLTEFGLIPLLVSVEAVYHFGVKLKTQSKRNKQW